MNLNDSTEMLLAFAWISEQERLKVERFPEFCSVDVTEKTNFEKRGLFQATFIDGDGGTFIGFRSYLPNAQMSSYNWIYEHAMPELFSTEILKRIQVVMSDGEMALYQPIQNLSEISSPWSGVKVMRCVYHLFTQAWAKVQVASTYSKDSVKDKTFVSEVKNMIEFMIFNVINEAQLNFCIKLFEDKLTKHKADVSENVMYQIHCLWFDSMKPQRSKWCQAFKNDSMDFLHYISSITVSMNHSLKSSAKGSHCLAKLNLDRSAKAILNHSVSFNSRKEK